MTKFIGLKEKKVCNKTVFYKSIGISGTALNNPLANPNDWDNVQLIYSCNGDANNFDVFIAWDDGEDVDRRIYLGKAGDEFE